MAETVLRVTIGRKQDKVVGCFYIVIAPDKNGRWKVIDQDPIAGWRVSSKRGMLAINVWRKWNTFDVSDYRAHVSFCSIYDKQNGSRPNNIDFNDIFPPRPIPAWSSRRNWKNIR